MQGNIPILFIYPHMRASNRNSALGIIQNTSQKVSTLYLSPHSDFLCSDIREPPCWQPPLLRPPLACICLSNKPLGTCSHWPWYSGYWCSVFELENNKAKNQLKSHHPVTLTGHSQWRKPKDSPLLITLIQNTSPNPSSVWTWSYLSAANPISHPTLFLFASPSEMLPLVTPHKGGVSFALVPLPLITCDRHHVGFQFV